MTKTDRPSSGKSFPTPVTHDPSNYRILAAGKTHLYIPLSWLRCMQMLPTSAVSKGTVNDAAMGYISPAFQDIEPPDVVHHIIRNQEMAQGVIFRFDLCGSSGESVVGVSRQSQVYQIAIAYRPKSLVPRFTNLQRIKQGVAENGWVLWKDTYYDVSAPIASDADVYAIPVAIGPTGGDSNLGQFRYNDDVVVTARWRGQQSLEFHGPWVRRTQQSVRELIDRLTNKATEHRQTDLILGERSDN